MLPDSEKVMKSIEGNVHLYDKEYEKALECFIGAGMQRNFIRLARASLEAGYVKIAITSFELAGIEPTRKERKIIQGDLVFMGGELMEAHRIYKDADAKGRLRNLGLHALQKGYVLIALSCYKDAMVKPPGTELENFVKGYIENIDERIKTHKHIGVKEACLALGDKEMLKTIGNILIGKGEILLGICFYEDSGEKFPAENLKPSQRARLISEGDEVYRDGIRFDHFFYKDCIRAYATAGARDRLMELLDLSFDRDDLEPALEILRILYGNSLRKNLPDEMAEKVISYARIHFGEGDCRKGLKAYDAIGRKAPHQETYAGAQKCFFAADDMELIRLSPEVFKMGLKAYKKAGLAPSRAKIVAAGYNYLNLKFPYYARQAFEAALSAEHLKNLIRHFESEKERIIKDKEDPLKIEEWAANINSKDLDEDIKKELIELRNNSIASAIRFQDREICEAKEALRRVENKIGQANE